jgi:hypothetical protein
VPSDPSPATRQCNRCRLCFEGDRTLVSFRPEAFWLCPPCRERLLGLGRRGIERARRDADLPLTGVTVTEAPS